MAQYVEKWLDYANGWPSGAAVKAAGFTGTIRYTTAPRLMNPPGKNQKHITKTEYDDHRANGVKIRLVFQGGTTDADGGWALGVANAKLALEGANYLGYNGVIFFCNDRPELPNIVSWRAYLDGAASVLGIKRVGAYGFQNALNAAVGHASAFWQAGSESKLVPHANYWQWNNGRAYVAGIQCDVNYVIKDYDLAGGGSPGSTTRRRMQDMIEKPLPKALSDGFQIIESSGYEGAKVVIYPGVGDDGGIKPVWLEHLFNYASGRVGSGGDPVAGLPSAIRIDWPTEFALPTGTLTCGVAYSTEADAVVRTFG